MDCNGIFPRLNALNSEIHSHCRYECAEVLLVPDLLLWGRLNLLFAFLFIVLIWYNEFYLRLKPAN